MVVFNVHPQKINVMKAHHFVLYLLIIIAGTVWSVQESNTPTYKQPIKTISYLALGDSYTVGEAVGEKESWPYILQEGLKNNAIAVSDFKLVAKTGWRTDELLKKSKKEVKKQQYDLVSLLIGVNNEFQGKSPESFEKEFTNCLDFAIEHSIQGKKGVFVLSIPDYAYTPYGKGSAEISDRIDEYNAICERISKREGVPFYNITAISRKGLEDPTFVAADNLHPSAIQHKIWSNSILFDVIAQIKQL